MLVREMMSGGVRTCTTADTLNTVARLMWENDCGCVPVIDADARPIAMITDRDVCMAAYTQGKPLDQISVGSAASRGVVTVSVDDTLEEAEAMMQKYRIRRVPVVGADGRVAGVLSMNDLARHVQRTRNRSDSLSAESIVRTLAAVGQPTSMHV
ncbi:MAG TPA: CBS domain-containing protein [Polyangiaceae bacterium]|nr:CBS domain-containing protein [Polyangiaceae bacterium]